MEKKMGKKWKKKRNEKKLKKKSAKKLGFGRTPLQMQAFQRIRFCFYIATKIPPSPQPLIPTGLNCIGKTQDSAVLNREDYTYVYASQFDLAIKECKPK